MPGTGDNAVVPVAMMGEHAAQTGDQKGQSHVDYYYNWW